MQLTCNRDAFDVAGSELEENVIVVVVGVDAGTLLLVLVCKCNEFHDELIGNVRLQPLFVVVVVVFLLGGEINSESFVVDVARRLDLLVFLDLLQLLILLLVCVFEILLLQLI